jgi:hypothetical protein
MTAGDNNRLYQRTVGLDGGEIVLRHDLMPPQQIVGVIQIEIEAHDVAMDERDQVPYWSTALFEGGAQPLIGRMVVGLVEQDLECVRVVPSNAVERWFSDRVDPPDAEAHDAPSPQGDPYGDVSIR